MYKSSPCYNRISNWFGLVKDSSTNNSIFEHYFTKHLHQKWGEPIFKFKSQKLLNNSISIPSQLFSSSLNLIFHQNYIRKKIPNLLSYLTTMLDMSRLIFCIAFAGWWTEKGARLIRKERWWLVGPMWVQSTSIEILKEEEITNVLLCFWKVLEMFFTTHDSPTIFPQVKVSHTIIIDRQ